MKEKIDFSDFFKFVRKLTLQKLMSMRLYWKLFTKNRISQKLNDFFEFYKNWPVVSTLRIHIKV